MFSIEVKEKRSGKEERRSFFDYFSIHRPKALLLYGAASCSNTNRTAGIRLCSQTCCCVCHEVKAKTRTRFRERRTTLSCFCCRHQECERERLKLPGCKQPRVVITCFQLLKKRETGGVESCRRNGAAQVSSSSASTVSHIKTDIWSCQELLKPDILLLLTLFKELNDELVSL